MFDYYTDKYGFTITHAAMMRDFNANDAGFTSYGNFQRVFVDMQGNKRPEKGGLRRVNANFELGGETEYNGRYPRAWLNTNINVTTMNYMYTGLGYNFSFSDYRRNYVDAGEPYEDHDNFGNYTRTQYKNGSEWWWWYESDFSKPIAFALNYDLGSYRKGYQHSLSSTLQVRPWSNLETRFVVSHTHIANVPDINEGVGTDYFVGRFKVDWTLTTKIFTRLNMQYVYEDKVYLTNALLGYNFAPQSWFYLVYDDTKDQLLNWQGLENRTIKMKLSYFVKA
jgi:hypothetical protein